MLVWATCGLMITRKGNGRVTNERLKVVDIEEEIKTDLEVS